ncbi:hypothetical protein SAMN06264364_11969 [Quadrisphaera granulorum]|uniref:Flagellar biosynthesis protein FlhF n=1 Tax=Quadrisphaera granulorum TaxID=317664 RepID=A0A316A6X9_9ACTN|nr:hypothetical protein [Quadrisphaera granulorum]PWJ52574.1 hypothetical protein BXY45_11969 [Quadrisphaera granulorum]SZE97624.1 hypothetical protein SAMN06264364_11969 [Quadrisphaera granulorum]
MAPTRLLLEGPELEPLLQQVRADHGAGVRIVKAERVRVGGFVGFFAREQFEVTIEVDGPVGPPTSVVRPRVPAAASAEAVRRAPAPLAVGSRGVAAGGTGSGAAAGSAGAGGPMGIEQLLEAAEAAERAPGSLSGFDSIFSDALSSITTTPTSPLAQQPPAPAPVPVQAARPAVGHAMNPAMNPPMTSAINQASIQAALQAAVQAGLRQPTPPRQAEVIKSVPVTRPARPPYQPPAQQPRTVLPETPVVTAHVAPAPIYQEPVYQEPVYREPAPVHHAPVHHAPSHRAPANPLAERLAELGVPEAWLHRLPADRAAALRHVAAYIAAQQARRPRPAMGPAPVIGVLGDPTSALQLARRLGAGLGVHASDVAVVQRREASGARVLTDPADVAAEAAQARLGGHPLVVALPAPIGASSGHRAAVVEVLDALGADEVWAVVDATRRLPDTAAWLASFGGDDTVDALALVNIRATSAPAAALGLVQPVVVLGERPASPRAWAQVIAARLRDEDVR